jgi:hypothetical protein
MAGKRRPQEKKSNTVSFFSKFCGGVGEMEEMKRAGVSSSNGDGDGNKGRNERSDSK